MISIASVRQAIRLAELFESGSIVDHYVIANDLQTEPEAIHVKEFRADGTIHNWFIDAEGNSPIKGLTSTWAFIPTKRKRS